MQFSHTRFSRNKASQWSTEASDLQLPVGRWPAKFSVEENNTTTAYKFHHREKGPDGELLAYVYVPEDSNPRIPLAHPQVTIWIFND